MRLKQAQSIVGVELQSWLQIRPYLRLGEAGHIKTRPINTVAIRALAALLAMALGLGSNSIQARPSLPGTTTPINQQTFIVHGVVKELKLDGRTAVIAHGAISNYMAAMTMPFRVRDAGELAGLQNGDRISFRLHVTENESWIDKVSQEASDGVNHKTHQTEIGSQSPEVSAVHTKLPNLRRQHPLMTCHFTNELGRAVSLADFHGQALAITFFFTRCPIPEYCPRLSKNFAEASQKLAAMSNAPGNWHFLSISFDPEFDTAPKLKAYAETYHYDSAHWSFLTGPADKIRELANQCDVQFGGEGEFFNHNFRTLIVDAAGHLQMVFPTSGDLSDAIVSEILKATAVTNGPS